MSIGIFGRKVGMTQIFGPEGDRIAVTVVDAGPCTVVKVKTEDGPDGYNAVVVGYGDVKAKKVNKPKAGFFAKQGVEAKAHLREARLEKSDMALMEVGQELRASVFSVGSFVDVVGTSIGRGFAGVIKRHNFNAPKATHGTHEKFRHGGSLGQNTTPGRVFKGKKMAGHYGNARITVQNLLIVGVEDDKNLLLVKGSIPGPNGRLVWMQKASKG
ncbi:MAG: 50S ribosomal protein L3 [Myxococcales bacterium]|nr:50S ribosomal protein L3 [Myxococcales bacterium]